MSAELAAERWDLRINSKDVSALRDTIVMWFLIPWLRPRAMDLVPLDGYPDFPSL